MEEATSFEEVAAALAEIHDSKTKFEIEHKLNVTKYNFIYAVEIWYIVHSADQWTVTNLIYAAVVWYISDLSDHWTTEGFCT